MALARIFTHSEQIAAGLAARLREQGYEVEFCLPGETRSGVADIELHARQRSATDALAAASAFAQGKDTDVFVAPGAITPATHFVPNRSSEEADQARRAAELSRREEAARREREGAAERARLAATLRAEQQQAELARQREQAERLALRREEAERLAKEREEILAREREDAARRQKEREEIVVRQREEVARHAEELARERERAAAMEAAAREEELVRLARERQGAQHTAADTTQRGIEQLTAPYIPARRRAAAARVHRPRSSRDRQWRMAAVASVTLAILMAVGWSAIANRGPANPLGSEQVIRSTQVEQSAPFGPAQTRPSAVAPERQPATMAVQPKQAVKPAPKPSPVRRAQRSSAEDEVEVYPEDVVVRHYQRQASAATANEGRSGVKLISDLEQE